MNVSVPGVQDIRLVLRAQHVLEQYGVCDDGYTHAASAVRRKRIQAVGVRQYIYDVLGGNANRPVGHFRLWHPDGPVVLPAQFHDEKVVDVLVDFGLVGMDLPYQLRIEFGENGKQNIFYV